MQVLLELIYYDVAVRFTASKLGKTQFTQNIQLKCVSAESDASIEVMVKVTLNTGNVYFHKRWKLVLSAKNVKIGKKKR